MHLIDGDQDAKPTLFESHGQCLAFAPDRNTLAIGCDDGKLRLWNVKTKTMDATIPAHAGAVDQVAFANDGMHIYTASSVDRLLRQWTLDPPKKRFEIALDKTPTCVALWIGGRTVTGHVDGELSLWDLESGKRIYRYYHSQKITAVAISPDGQKAICHFRIIPSIAMTCRNRAGKMIEPIGQEYGQTTDH